MLFLCCKFIKSARYWFIVELIGCITRVHSFDIGHFTPVRAFRLFACKSIETKCRWHVALAGDVAKLPFWSYLWVNQWYPLISENARLFARSMLHYWIECLSRCLRLKVNVYYPVRILKILTCCISFYWGRRNIQVLDGRLTQVSMELLYQVVLNKLIRIALVLLLFPSTFAYIFVGHWVLLNTVWPT